MVVAEVVVEFPPIVKPPTIVVEAFWKMFVPLQRLLVVVPKAREIALVERESGYVKERADSFAFHVVAEVIRSSANVPIQYGVKVWAVPLETMVIPRLVSAVDVANV